MHALNEFTRLTRFLVMVVLIGTLALGSAGSVVVAGSIAQAPTCAAPDGSLELVVDVAEVTYRQADESGQPVCDEIVPPGESRLVGEFGTLEVGDNGRASLLRDVSLRFLVFGNSRVTVAPDLETAGETYPQLYLEQGAMSIDNPLLSMKDSMPATPGDDTPDTTDPGANPEVVMLTDEGSLTSIGGSFFVYTFEGFTWLVVSGGVVEVTASDRTVSVPAGWQTWIEPDAPPQRPLPASRSVVDVQFQGNLPQIGTLTNDHLQDDSIFATCGVQEPSGTDLRFGPGIAQPVVDHVRAGAEFAASYRASDVAWVFGEVDEASRGWAESSNLNCPFDPAFLPTSDDGDADAAPDIIDNCGGISNPDQADLDLDGVGDACVVAPLSDGDSDDDGVLDDADNCPDVANPDQADREPNDVGDACEGATPSDSDGDGIPNLIDNCIRDSNVDQADRDQDDVGDRCDGDPGGGPPDDLDGDGFRDVFDNCPTQLNPDQADADQDGIGDACENAPPSDLDGDGRRDVFDNCPLVSNPGQADADRDGEGDACDASLPDGDRDDVPDDFDNCPDVPNSDQADSDEDDVGDACDVAEADFDGDDDPDRLDNCRDTYNPDQTDSDGDLVGDACDRDATPPAVHRDQQEIV